MRRKGETKQKRGNSLIKTHFIDMICFRLILSDCHWVTSASLQYLASKQDNLMSINLTGCWELNDETIVDLLEKFKR